LDEIFSNWQHWVPLLSCKQALIQAGISPSTAALPSSRSLLKVFQLISGKAGLELPNYFPPRLNETKSGREKWSCLVGGSDHLPATQAQ
jgi:hypothetical protein